MGNCPSVVNCDAEIYRNAVHNALEVDPDICGPGVLASFLISGSLAMLVIFIGYFTDSLPRRHLHKIDRVFIRQTRESWIFSTCAPSVKAVFASFTRAVQRSHVMRMHMASVPREIRVEALLRFLLVNSDQQLVTGLAVLTGGLARRCDLSAYEFQIVSSLGWFSTTTHLATLSVLTNYFRDHPEVLVLRLIGMGVTLIILSFSITVSLLRTSFLRAPWQCAIGSFENDGGEIAVVFVLLLYLVGAFVSRIINLVVDARKSKRVTKRQKANLNALSHETSLASSDRRRWIPFPNADVEVSHHDAHEETGFINSYAKIIIWLYARFKGRIPNGEEFSRILPIALANAENQRDSYFDSATSTSWENKKSWTFYADLLSVDFCNSFAFGFSILVFAFSFGIAQTIQSRQTLQEGTKRRIRVSGGERNWGFGQIVPLFLLALPLLAAAEIYFESRRKAHSHFYALAIAEGEFEADEQLGNALNRPGLSRQDTITPKPYKTFFDTPLVKYVLRITVLLTTGLLAYAGAALEVNLYGVGDGVGISGIVIVAVVSLFAVYATFREVYLVWKEMKEVAWSESHDCNTTTAIEAQ